MRLAPLLIVCLLAAPVVQAADRPAGLQPLPEIPPPPGIVDADLEPHITIVQRGADRVEEFRLKGRLYMLKVTPPHGRPYYLIDQLGDGQMSRFEGVAPSLMVPMWVIFEF